MPDILVLEVPFDSTLRDELPSEMAREKRNEGDASLQKQRHVNTFKKKLVIDIFLLSVENDESVEINVCL